VYAQVIDAYNVPAQRGLSPTMSTKVALILSRIFRLLAVGRTHPPCVWRLEASSLRYLPERDCRDRLYQCDVRSGVE